LQTNRSNNRKNINFSCYNCGKTGRYSRDCREKRSDNRGGGKEVDLEKAMADLRKKMSKKLPVFQQCTAGNSRDEEI